MLWKKESKKPDALYVDIFARCKKYLEDEFRRIHRQYTQPMPKKDDAIALENRNKGNAFFRSNQFYFAMELYNESLRFAVPGSQHICLAYANRSYCFLKLNMFDKCLADIELAKKAGYPEQLVHKLDERKAECLERMEKGAESYKIGGKLSYDADKNFPCMANVLKVQTEFDGKFIVVAKEDIDVDKTIVVEDLMFPFALKRPGLMCNICTKRCENFEPCEKCAMALLCPNCKGHFLHKYECGLSFCGQSSYNNEVMTEVRRIITIIKMFTTADELMAFVKQMQIGANKLPANMKDDKAKYQAFFNLPPTDDKHTDMPHCTPILVYPVYQTVLKVPEIKAMFRSQKHLRFLMHLIAHHELVPPSVARFGGVTQPVPGMPDDDKPTIFSNGHHLMDKYTRHSCYPNVVSIMTNGQNVLVTARPIKKGEQVLESRILINIASKQERQKQLLTELGKKCDCARCRGITASLAERHQLSSDPAYNSGSYIKWMLSNFLTDTNNNHKEVIKDSVTILQKYGHVDWCDEIQSTIMHYMAALYVRVAGGNQ